MDITLIASFLGVAIVLTFMPGPDILFVIAQSISQDRKAGMITALGLCSGLLVHITAAALGISAIVYQSALAFSIIKYAGAIYLLYLAWNSFKEKDAALIEAKEHVPYMSLYKKGIFMNLLNPKVSIFFIALLPQFVNKSIGHVPIQMIILGVLFILQAIVVFIGVSMFSDKIRLLLEKNNFLARKIPIIKGCLLALIGLQIAFSQK